MREMYMEKIDKNIVEEVERNIRFVDPVDIAKYDYITIGQDTIELSREEYKKTPIYDKKTGELKDYDYENISVTRGFKRNNVSGVYVEY